MFFLGADCADFWVQTVQQRARNVILRADCADFGCRLARDPESWRKMKYQDNESDSDDVEIHVIRLLLREE